MLGKLMKYEIPALGRKLLPLYAGWAATAVLLGFTVTGKGDGFIQVLSALLYGGLAIAVFVMAVVLIVQRFSGDLLGDGGYFSHVLPVSASAHILNKTLTATIWIWISFFVAIVTGIIVGLIAGGTELIQQILGFDWSYVLSRITGGDVMILIELIIVAVISTAKSILAIYAALTIGHQAKNRTGLCSLVAYIGLMIFESLVGRIMLSFPNLVEAFDNAGGVSEGDFAIALGIGGVVAFGLATVYFLITKYLMEKKLNLA